MGYRPIFLECKHAITFSRNSHPPKEGEVIFCPRCGTLKLVIATGAMWKVRCKHCDLGLTKESRGEARAAARSHMLRKRHTVMIWDLKQAPEELQDGEQTSMEIFQPATNLQLTLSDEPPF